VTVAGRRLRITRRPEQERLKRSGAGFTREPASVLLDEAAPAGNWVNKSTRIGEADAEIEQLMGMSAEQFFQVVLLPQGEFAQFLRADAKNRAALLQKLFGTDRFRAVEDWLAARRRSTAAAVEAGNAALSQLMARIAQVAGVAVPEQASGQAAAASPDEAVAWQLTWADGLAVQARARSESAAKVAAARRAELDAAQDALHEAGQLADRQRRRGDAEGRQAALHAEQGAMRALRGELEAANRAAEVAPVLDEATRARDAAAIARAAAQQARDVLQSVTHDDPAGLARAGAEELRAAARDQQETLGRLEVLRSVARQARLELAAAAQAREQAAELEAALAECHGEAQRLRESRPGARDALNAASRAAADAPAARAGAQAARRVATDIAALAAEREARARVAEDHRVAADEALTLNKDYELIRRTRIEGMSGELARNLVDGSPCPVCGSPDHPEPSEMPATWASPDDEKHAYQLAREAAGRAESAGQKVAAADAVIASLIARLAGAGVTVTGDPAALAASALAAEADAKRLEAAADDVAAIAAGLAASQQELEDLTRALAATEKRQAELSQQRSAALERAQDAQQRSAGHAEALRAQLGDVADPGSALESAMAQARQLAQALGAAADAAEDEARTERQAQAAGERATRAAAAAGFAGAAGAPGDPAPGHLARPGSGSDPASGDPASGDLAIGGPASGDLAIGGPVSGDPAIGGPASGYSASGDPASDSAVGPGQQPDAALSAARAALRDAPWRASAAEALRKHEAELASVAKLLADPELDVPLEPAAPVAEREAAVMAARAEHEAAVGAHDVARATASQLSHLRPQLADALAALAPLIAAAAEARQLADLTAGLGGNRYKMTLSSFVLAARLEEVAAAASQRLLAMTAGRYALAHTDARKGGGKAGLGLLACDSWTGQDRDTSTLSGGETFLASLALALGLADVVTAEAAGTPMEALFVDEGFGTLDEDTLEEVMTVLDGLREGGRMVGIVSHVSELRQRIPAQVHVRKGHHGSHVHVTAG
jgi:DNA repair protein SbcC/Rad50